MREFSTGDLKTNAGEKVTERKQALAIAISIAKRAEAARPRTNTAIFPAAARRRAKAENDPVHVKFLEDLTLYKLEVRRKKRIRKGLFQ